MDTGSASQLKRIATLRRIRASSRLLLHARRQQFNSVPKVQAVVVSVADKIEEQWGVKAIMVGNDFLAGMDHPKRIIWAILRVCRVVFQDEPIGVVASPAFDSICLNVLAFLDSTPIVGIREILLPILQLQSHICAIEHFLDSIAVRATTLSWIL